MILRNVTRIQRPSLRRSRYVSSMSSVARKPVLWYNPTCAFRSLRQTRSITERQNASRTPISPFHSTAHAFAQPSSADGVMETLNELYATAKDEFEIAAEETQKKTVYAAEDREACSEAFKALKEAFEASLKQNSPDVAKEVQGRVGQRIRELENAIKAMEELAMED